MPAQIALTQKTIIGRALPDDLREFYLLSNGTRSIVDHSAGFPDVRNRLLPVERLFWEDEEYVQDYQLNLLPGTKPPVEIEWPGIIQDGAIAMYEHDGQGTDYVWYVSENALSKARKSLEDAYNNTTTTAEEKKTLDKLVQLHHGSWEKLRGLKQCWYQHSWGDPDSMIVFHDFRAFLSLVVSSSVLEENKNPIKPPGK